jgi:hypothetical protein
LWLQVGSDPYKVQAFRGIQRLVSQHVTAGSLHRDDPTLVAYLHRLLSVSEHNQGFGTQHYPNNILTGGYTGSLPLRVMQGSVLTDCL